jgi:chromate transporter
MLLAEIAFYFALLSIVSVGGMPSVMPEMQRFMVEVNAWMSAAEFTQLFAVAQAAPGPNVLVTALLGWKVAGVAGGIIALAAFCGPAGALAWWAGGFWDRMRDAPWRKTVQRALVPVTVGFICAGGYVLATPGGLDWRNALIAIAAAVLMVKTKLNPLWILAGGGLLGAVLL